MKIVLTIFVVIILYSCKTSKYGFSEVNNKADQTITLPTVSSLEAGSYIIQLRIGGYEEPVSMLPLAVIAVFGLLLIIGGIIRIYEFIKTGK